MRIAAVVAALIAVAAPARADKVKAEQYFHAGAEAFKLQSFAAAAAQFELAYHELELPEIAFSAAQAYRRQYFIDPKPEYVQRAVALYRAYLDKVKTGGRVGDASDSLAEMQHELDRLTARGVRIGEVAHAATRLTVSVLVEGESATVVGELTALPAGDKLGATATLDGKAIELFAPLDVEPGEHVVAVRAAGYAPIQEHRRVAEGAAEVVELRLKALPGKLAVHTEPGAGIAVDGRTLGQAPLVAQELAAGKHILAITARGREARVRELELARGQTLTLDAPLVPTVKRRAVPWVLGGTAVLAVLCGTATGFALAADSNMSSLERTRETTGITASQLADYRDQGRSRDAWRDAAFALGGAAVIAGAAAATLYWFDVPKPDEHTMIVPAAAPNGAAVAIIRRF